MRQQPGFAIILTQCFTVLISWDVFFVFLSCLALSAKKSTSPIKSCVTKQVRLKKCAPLHCLNLWPQGSFSLNEEP